MREDMTPLQSSLEQLIGRAHEGYHEPTYACPFCATRGFADNPGRIHVNYVKNKALCHRCGFATRSVESIIFKISGKLPKLLLRRTYGNDVYRAVTSILKGEDKKEEAEERCVLPPEYLPLTFPPRGIMAKKCVEYLKARGLSQQTIEECQTGYAIQGRFRGRAIFPIFVGESLRFFTARSFMALPGPKILHSEVARGCIVFNFNRAARARRIFINEGVFDALSWPRDLGVGIATMGHKLAEDQARLLLSMKKVKEFVVCYDADAYPSTVEAAHLLHGLAADHIKVTLIKLKRGDPNSERDHLRDYFEKRTEFSISDVVCLGLGGHV